MIKDAHGKRRQSYAPGGYVPWQMDAPLLWTADHLVKELPRRDPKSARSEHSQGLTTATPTSVRELWSRVFSFDFARAELEVAQAKVAIERSDRERAQRQQRLTSEHRTWRCRWQPTTTSFVRDKWRPLQ